MKNEIKQDILNLYDMKKNSFSLVFLTTITVLLFAGCVEITAERFDEENKCWNRSSEVVDTQFNIGLGGSSSLGSDAIAQGPSGAYWRFVSTDLPDDYKEVHGQKRSELSNAPRCE